MTRFVWLGLLLVWGHPAAGQPARGQPVTAQAVGLAQPDTQHVVLRRSPVGAFLRSAALPGWGQFYNDKSLKGALFIVLQAGLITGVLLERGSSRSGGLTPLGSSLLLGLIGVRVYSMADAYVDAQFSDFDRPDELGQRRPIRDHTIRLSAGVRLRRASKQKAEGSKQ